MKKKKSPAAGVVCYLSLGSNLGRRAENLERAIARLAQHPQVQVLRVSPAYETSPVGPRQRAFLNLAVEIRTSLAPDALLSLIKRIERALGRKPGPRWGPRVIDLDILTYGRLQLQTPRLILPHPELAQRKFVLWPLKDLAPGLKIPGLNRTVRALCARLTDPDQRAKLTTQFPR